MLEPLGLLGKLWYYMVMVTFVGGGACFLIASAWFWVVTNRLRPVAQPAAGPAVRHAGQRLLCARVLVDPVETKGDTLTASNPEGGDNSHFALRVRIMRTLYGHFRQFPYAPMDMQQLVESCGGEHAELNWNLVYLEKSGWIELGRAESVHPYVACTVELTASGIDLVEDRSRFAKHFHISEGLEHPAAPENEAAGGG